MRTLEVYIGIGTARVDDAVSIISVTAGKALIIIVNIKMGVGCDIKSSVEGG